MKLAPRLLPGETDTHCSFVPSPALRTTTVQLSSVYTLHLPLVCNLKLLRVALLGFQNLMPASKCLTLNPPLHPFLHLLPPKTTYTIPCIQQPCHCFHSAHGVKITLLLGPLLNSEGNLLILIHTVLPHMPPFLSNFLAADQAEETRLLTLLNHMKALHNWAPTWGTHDLLRKV